MFASEDDADMCADEGDLGAGITECLPPSDNPASSARLSTHVHTEGISVL